MKNFKRILENVIIFASLFVVVLMLIFDANYVTLKHFGYKAMASESKQEEILNKSFNKKVEKAVNYRGNVETKDNVNTCVIENEGDHRKSVVGTLKHFYKGDVEIFELDTFLYDSQKLLQCDVINASFRVNSGFDGVLGYNTELFFEKWDGLFITSAGNEGSKLSEEVQPFNSMKEEYPNQIIAVGEAHMHFNKIYYSNVSHGKEVDIVVPSRNLSINGEIMRGTSMSTPVVVAKAANLLQENDNLTKEELYNKTLESDVSIKHKKGGKTYEYDVLQF